MIRFIDTLYRQLGTTGSYGATADLHTLQFTAANTSVVSLHSVNNYFPKLRPSKPHKKD
jgi:hypothetical protein